MKTSRFITYCFIASLLSSVAHAQNARVTRERLSLDAAIQQAVDHNRLLETAKLQVEKAEDDLAVAKTRRLPIFETTVTASRPLCSAASRSIRSSACSA